MDEAPARTFGMDYGNDSGFAPSATPHPPSSILRVGYPVVTRRVSPLVLHRLPVAYVRDLRMCATSSTHPLPHRVHALRTQKARSCTASRA